MVGLVGHGRTKDNWCAYADITQSEPDYYGLKRPQKRNNAHVWKAFVIVAGRYVACLACRYIGRKLPLWISLTPRRT